LLVASNNGVLRKIRVFNAVWGPNFLTENDTRQHMMRVRIVRLPRIGEFDELNLHRRFKIGEVYELPAQLAVTLMIAGYAETPVFGATDVAADAPPRRRRRATDKN
jgi:hypothetical protein